MARAHTVWIIFWSLAAIYLVIGLGLTIYMKRELRSDTLRFYLLCLISLPVAAAVAWWKYSRRGRGHSLSRDIFGALIVVVTIALYVIFFGALQD